LQRLIGEARLQKLAQGIIAEAGDDAEFDKKAPGGMNFSCISSRRCLRFVEGHAGRHATLKKGTKGKKAVAES
jgi:hypothetical protein